MIWPPEAYTQIAPGKKLRRGSVDMNWAGNEGAVWWDFGLADGLVNFFITLFFVWFRAAD